MKTGYYPGCSMHGTSREFSESLHEVTSVLEAELHEITDWNCCGASSAHASNHQLAVALPARNLALAEAQGFDEVVAPCAACYNRLASAQKAMAEDPHLARSIQTVLERPFTNTVQVHNILEMLIQYMPALKAKVQRPLKGLKVACYYGCLLVRPATLSQFDDAEQPSTMEEILKACGATPVKWNMALECCGGAFSVSRPGSVVRLSRAILDDARQAGADAIAVGCPMCHSNLDFRQRAVARRGDAPVPVLYITELVGLALGLNSDALGLARHFVSAEPLLAKLAPVTTASGEAH
jgi:heterodisulfide reductase subunit B2